MVNTRATVVKLQKHSGALAGFNDDLLIEIFLRLPLTSVARFKSVSKHWQSLLCHRSFTLLYKRVSISLGFFFRKLYIPFDDEKQSSPPFRALDFYPDPFGIKIVQSCNGLLLCCSNCRDREKRDRKYYVFNPTTKQFALIPSVPGAGNVGRSIYSMALAFHQTDCAQYKLVCIVEGIDRRCEFQVYSSDKARWKNIPDQSFYLQNYTKCLGVYWNQAIYWGCQFLCFKLDTEELQEMPMPLGVSSYNFRGEYFGESGGYLHMAEGADEHINSHIHLNVYEMLNDHSGWFLKYRVELDDFRNAYPDMISRISELSTSQVLDVVRGEEEEDTFIVIRIVRELVIRYNVADRSFKEISRQNPVYVHDIIGPEDVHRYIATLASF